MADKIYLPTIDTDCAMDIFPYKPRKHQRQIIDDIEQALQQRQHLVFESGTGSGKTVCVLAATIAYALKHHNKILYTTRTNAQQQQVILEIREIQKKANNPKIFGVGLQGRTNMCLLIKKEPDLANGTSEELSRFCSNQKKMAQTMKKNAGCPYYQNIIKQKQVIDTVLDWAKQQLPTAEEFIAFCERKRVCPYEVNKLLVTHALVVVVPYVYVFDKSIYLKLINWLSVADDDIVLVVDEAHNLPDYLRELFSAHLSKWMLTSCLYEAEKYGDPGLGHDGFTIKNFCTMLLTLLENLRDTYIYCMLENGIRRNTSLEKNDAFIPSHELETELYSRLHVSSKTFRDVIADLCAYGEKIQEYRQKAGKLPRSYLHKLAGFLDFWTSIEMDQYIKLVVDTEEGKNPHIEAYCLDPSVGTTILTQVHCSIHMSGTLKPLEEYRDSLGLDKNTVLKLYPSPFSLENRRVYFTSDVTTKYDDLCKDKTIIPRAWKYISAICNTFPKNTMVFFPSFNTLSMFRNDGRFEDINRCLYIEDRAMTQTAIIDMVSEFKGYAAKKNGAAFFSVMGGRISEGMDFPAEQLEIAVIVGIPYPKPTARQRGLQHYYEKKFRKGWEYTVETPAARKMLQAIGRLIRNESDRGVAVILDKRARRFHQYIEELQESHNLVHDINQFMKQ